MALEIRIKTTIDAFVKRLRSFRDLVAAGRAANEALEVSADYMVYSIKRRWEAEIDPLERAWQPLAESTIARKKSQGRILKILQATGQAKEYSVHYQIRRNLLIIGFGRQYSYMNFHQTGTSKLPKRVVLGYSKKDRLAITQIFKTLGVNSAGFKFL